jgi:tetratricopeptide (TPR) repeat protein
MESLREDRRRHRDGHAPRDAASPERGNRELVNHEDLVGSQPHETPDARTDQRRQASVRHRLGVDEREVEEVLRPVHGHSRDQANAEPRVFLGAAATGRLDSSVDGPVVRDIASTPRSWLRWLAPAIPVASAFLLALTRIDDPDAFTHLALGRDLVQQRGFPAHEPFSFGSLDRPYYNSEWLFDVVFYLGYLLGGTAGVIVLKSAIIALVAWILWLDSRPGDRSQADSSADRLVRSAALTAVVVMMHHRFVERPDIALMVFLAFTIYALNAWIRSGRRFIFWLPLVQILWANTHPSIIVGLVPFIAVLGGGVGLHVGARILARWWRLPEATIPSWRRLGVVAAVLVGVLAASLLNPYRLDPLTLPFTLADQPWFRQEILELQPPRPGAWPGPFVLTGLLLVSFVATVPQAPLIPALLALPFVRLGLSAVRFVFLLELVGGPILARNLASLVARAAGRLGSRLVFGAAAAALAVMTVVTTAAGVGPLADARKAAGVGVNTRWVPEGALRYLDSRGVEGRLFNAFHFGGYIEWRDFPKRAPIVDGRGHADGGLLEEIHFARVYSQHLERLRERYGLEAAVMDYPSYSGARAEDVLGPDADAALASPDWALVFWDDVALVYLPRRGRHAATLARDEYRLVKPANGAAGIARLIEDPSRATAARAELARNARETGSSLGWLLSGYAAPDPDAAIAAFERVRDPARRFEAEQAIAAANWRKKDFARATAAFDRALAMEPAAPILYNAGLVRAQAGDDRGAIRYLRRAQRADPDLAPVYAALVEAYRRLGDETGAGDLGPAFLAAATRAKLDQHVAAALRLMSAGRTAEAEGEVAAALRLDPRSAAALSAQGYVRMAERRLDEATQAQQAALAADPRYARAHWALAQIARARGDERAAREHLAAFVKLAPRTYEAWRAKEELAAAR